MICIEDVIGYCSREVGALKMEKELSVIIPAYNEDKQIYNNLLEINKIIGSFCNSYELIAVNDGSIDNTKSEIRKAADVCPNICATGYDKNKGKGGAIKHGVKIASGEYIAFLDADLDLSPLHLKAFMERIKETGAAAVIGSKMHKDSKVDYPLPRRIMSICYFIMLKLLFRLNVKDTQTGVKLFDAKELNKIITQVRTSGFAYDIEILALINQNKGRIEEMPIELVFRRECAWGRIKFSDIIGVAKDTFKIWKNVHKVKRMGVWCEKAIQ